MNILSPETSRPQNNSRLPHDGNSTFGDYNPSSPVQGKQSTGQPLFATVDNLILPGVIGATVEGPKTPIRSPKARRVYNYFNLEKDSAPFATRYNNNSNLPQTHESSLFERANMSSPSATRGYSGAHADTGRTRYIDTEIDLVADPSAAGFRTPQSRRVMTTSSQQWRRNIRPQDTPVARSEKRPRSDGTPYLYRTSPLGDVSQESGQESSGEDEKRRALDSTTRRSQEAQRVPIGNEAHDHDGHARNTLNVTADQDRWHDHSPSFHENEFEEEEEDYVDEEAMVAQLEREEAERQREQEQLGFIKRWANLLRKQRDEFGWGTPKQPGYVSDSDNSDNSFTSARVRRTTFKKQATKPATFIAPSMRHLDSGVGMNNWRDSQHHNEQQHAFIDEQDELIDDGRRPGREQWNAPVQLKYDSDSEDLEVDSDLDGVYENSPLTRRKVRAPQPYRTVADRYKAAEMEQPIKRVYPWHVLGRYLTNLWVWLSMVYMLVVSTLQAYSRTLVNWVYTAVTWPWAQRGAIQRFGEGWIDAGVSLGLLSPGTLAGMALLCLAVWSSQSFGLQNLGSPARNSGQYGINDTLSSGAFIGGFHLREALSETWDKLTGFGSSLSGSDRQRKGSVVRHWQDRVPQMPSIPRWLHSNRKSSGKIQIPTEQIQSLEELEARIEWIQKALLELGHADEQLSKELQTKMEGMSVWVSGVEHKLNRVSEDIESLWQYVKNGRWIEQTVLDLIRDEIPKYLVVKKDLNTGKLSIPGDFWDTARDLFMTSDQVQKTVEDQLIKKEEADSAPSSSGWSWGSNKAKLAGQGKILSWKDFLEENERAMGDFVEGRMTKVSRSVFLSLVKTEANQIWQGIEKNVVSLLEKQGKLQSKAAPPRRDYASTNTRSLTAVEKELISGLIDEALEKYSADVLAKPDYALHSAGGRIIPRLTSPNYYHVVKPNLLGRLGGRFFVPLPRREKPAEKAIEPDVHAGECWAMDGQQGQLAVRLARKVFVTEVTVEHADISVVLDMGSAAKEIEVWGLRGSEDAAPSSANPSAGTVADQSNLDTSYSAESTTEQGKQNQENGAQHSGGNWWTSGIPWPGATLLTTIQYDANNTTIVSQDGESSSTKAKSRQTFSIPLSKQNIPSVGVVFRIKSNWGNPQFTCLYRVRVHGHETSPATEP